MYKNLFKQTAIYGIATVVPRMLSFILVPLYTSPGVLPREEYGEVSILFAWMVFFNVLLSYGMETAFFRFYHGSDDRLRVISTSAISIFATTIAFTLLALLGRDSLADGANLDVRYIVLSILIIALDALVIIPFSRLRAEGRPMLYAGIKIGNVGLNLLLNVFFLLVLPGLADTYAWADAIYIRDFQVGYIFVANLVASLATFVYLLPGYFKMKWEFDHALWNRMMAYALPVLLAGVAFAINEHFDKILLEKLLPADIAKSETGAYSACYKIALFMTLFATAFRLGIEPFFFSHAGNANAPQTYATITKYFVIFGSVILLGVIVFADVIKLVLLPNQAYWEAMKVVPLIVLANLFLGIYTNLSIWYKLTDRTKMGAYISLVGAAVTLLLNFLLIPLWSYYGSAVATLAAYGAMMLISWKLGEKYYPIPYDIKKISGYLGLSVAFSGLSFYVFRENLAIGIALLLGVLGFVYYNEKDTLGRIARRKS